MTETLDLSPPPGGTVLHQTTRATVIWGDCTDPAVIAQAPDWYGLLCVDPPYGTAFRSNHGQNFDQIAGDDGSVDWPGVLAEWVGPEGTYTRGLANKRHVYVFGYRPEELAGQLRLGGTAELVWDKVMCGMGNLELLWGPGHDRIAFGVHIKQKSTRARGDGRLAARLRQGSVIRVLRPNAVTRLARRHQHPTEKPVDVMAQLIESSTVRGDLVVDPCAGSGSTGVAAVLEGRRCFLVELDRDFAQLAARRVAAAERIADQIDAA